MSNEPKQPSTRTEAQIEASQINGAKSHGPVTPEGKAVSSRNSTRHGLLSNTILIHGESKDEFDHLLASLVAEFEPETESQMLLVEEMAVCKWRQIRAWGIDAAGQSKAIQTQGDNSPQARDRSLPLRAWSALEELEQTGGTSERLQRYETRFSHQYFRLYRELAALQRRRDKLRKL